MHELEFCDYLHWLEDGMVVLSSGEEELHSKGPEVPVRIVLVTNVDHILQFCLQLSEGWGRKRKCVKQRSLGQFTLIQQKKTCGGYQ